MADFYTFQRGQRNPFFRDLVKTIGYAAAIYTIRHPLMMAKRGRDWARAGGRLVRNVKSRWGPHNMYVPWRVNRSMKRWKTHRPGRYQGREQTIIGRTHLCRMKTGYFSGNYTADDELDLSIKVNSMYQPFGAAAPQAAGHDQLMTLYGRARVLSGFLDIIATNTAAAPSTLYAYCSYTAAPATNTDDFMASPGCRLQPIPSGDDKARLTIPFNVAHFVERFHDRTTLQTSAGAAPSKPIYCHVRLSSDDSSTTLNAFLQVVMVQRVLYSEKIDAFDTD